MFTLHLVKFLTNRAFVNLLKSIKTKKHTINTTDFWETLVKKMLLYIPSTNSLLFKTLYQNPKINVTRYFWGNSVVLTINLSWKNWIKLVMKSYHVISLDKKFFHSWSKLTLLIQNIITYFSSIINFSQLELLSNTNIQAITASRPIDHNSDEKRSDQSMITEKWMLGNHNKILLLASNFKQKQLL